MSQYPSAPPINFDSAYLSIFSFPEAVRDLIVGFEGKRWAKDIDLDSLSREDPPDEPIWEGRSNAVIWRVERSDYPPGSFVLVFMFQPEVDHGTAFQVAARCSFLYEQDPSIDSTKRLAVSPVIPYVLYNGPTRWTAKTNTKDLIDYGPPAMGRFRLSFPHNVIEERFCPLLGNDVDNIAGMLFRAQRCRSVESLLAAIENSEARLHGNVELERAVVAWMKEVVLAERMPAVDFSSVSELDELKETLTGEATARVKTATIEGSAHGRRAGRADGLRLIVNRLARSKYGGQVEAEVANLTGSLHSGDSLREVAKHIRKSRTAKQLLEEVRKIWRSSLIADAVPGMDVH